MTSVCFVSFMNPNSILGIFRHIKVSDYAMMHISPDIYYEVFKGKRHPIWLIDSHCQKISLTHTPFQGIYSEK